MLSGFFNSINHLMKYFLLHFIGYDFFNNKSHLNLRQIFLAELINNSCINKNERKKWSAKPLKWQTNVLSHQSLLFFKFWLISCIVLYFLPHVLKGKHFIKLLLKFIKCFSSNDWHLTHSQKTIESSELWNVYIFYWITLYSCCYSIQMRHYDCVLDQKNQCIFD